MAVNGILNYLVDFFNTWLFGTGASSSLLPYAETLTILFSIIVCFCCVWFAFKLVTGLIKLVFYFFE